MSNAEIAAHLDGLGDDEVRKTADELKALDVAAEPSDAEPADRSKAPPSMRPFNANDPKAVAQHNNIIGRAVRLLIHDRAGKLATSIIEGLIHSCFPHSRNPSGRVAMNVRISSLTRR